MNDYFSLSRRRAADLATIIERLDPDGSLSLRRLAAKLTAECLPTARGGAGWTAAGISRVNARLSLTRCWGGDRFWA